MNKTGKVWLAGAGPGDAGLLTVKARQLIDMADAIVYDALVSAEILSLIPQEKEIIYVGKRSGHHLVPQEEINEILLREAGRGKAVLRLKGGDPFVFGRGGEELEALAEQGIPFEVVPGITSSVAVPAYAGIPITHRDYTSSFHVITGHPRKDGSSRIDFASLAKLGGTLVFLMSISSMDMILQGLMDAGLAKDTPAAVLENGTLSVQRSVVSTAEHLSEKAKEAGIGTPAIILVGEVCRLSELFSWAGKRPLGGRQIVTTRPRQNSSELAEKLRSLGAQVIELPSIRTRAITPNPALKRAMESFGGSEGQEWLVFTSPVGVQTFFEQLTHMHLDIRQIFRGPAQIKTAAIGSATERALLNYGLLTDVVPEVYCASELGKQIAQAAAPDSRITIVRAQDGSGELLPPLLQAGLDVKDIPLYETICETQVDLRERIETLLGAGQIDAVTFTSASTVRGFVQSSGPLDYEKICAVCIGEQTAKEAKSYGMQVYIAKKATIDSMTELITELMGNR